MKTWSVFLRLQNELAYGDSHSAPSRYTPAEHDIVRQWLAQVRESRNLERGLIVGPGSGNEILQLRDVLPAELHVLTSHLPEFEGLKAMSGFVAHHGDMHSTPFMSDCFDLIHASNVLEHALAPYCALMELRRIARPMGIGSFIMPAFEGDQGGVGPFHLHCLDPNVWRELLRKTGWTLIGSLDQEAGTETRVYHHFRCVAMNPPSPHDRVLGELNARWFEGR